MGKQMRNIKTRYILARLVIAFNTLVFCVFVYAQTDDHTVSVNGIREKVTVKRDNRGIPYISANNNADLYFAQGYVTASDRLWQMDLMRRLARGQTAELFGNATLEEDKRW